MQIPYQNCHVTIKCGENIAETELKSLSQIRSLLIITDDKLKTLYSHIIGDLPVIIVPNGEKAKSIETILWLFGSCLTGKSIKLGS